MTDLDSAYVKESDDIFDEEFVQSLVNAEVDGLRRQVELDKYTSDNDFVNAYYATNTFETELIKYLQNKKLFISVMKTAYKQEASFKKAVDEISSTDKRVRYKRALMFANKIGKGWLATSMVEHLNVNNRIPDYILSAVKFALGDRELNTIYEKILSYNMSCMGDECEKEFNSINSKPDLASKLAQYKECFSDTFVRFMEL
ncbi:hypothetical protein E4Q78_23525 [Salmonella enterica]|nr:hypothetical protein [Salmonella enterica]